MSLVSLRIVVAVTIAAGSVSASASAQQLPPPDQARRLMETRPDLVAQLRREIGSSGLTPDQIRARLRAAGYPEDLLDSYLNTRTTRGRDSLNVALPTEDVLDAIAALGIVDSVDTSELRNLVRRRPARADSLLPRDSLSLDDSLTVTRVDSLGRLVASARRRPQSVLRPPAIRGLDTGQVIFGLNIFSNQTTQFDPNLAGPVDAN